MRRPPRSSRRGLTAALLTALLVAGGLALLTGGGPLRSPAQADGATPAAQATAQTDDSLPATNVTMVGSSPGEAPGETWGVGESQGGSGAGPAILVH